MQLGKENKYEASQTRLSPYNWHTAQLIIQVIRTGELVYKQIVVTSTILIKKFMKNTPGVLPYIRHISMCRLLDRRKTQSHHHRLLFILSTKLRAASGIYKYRFTLIRYFKAQVWWWYKILLVMLTWKDYPTSTKWRFILTWISIQGIGKVAIEAWWL